ncbi:MAG: leucine-rich repeat protein, partial [Eubacterium sp.]|nr:leucine-rich repeat protein [Eubacterium sp.]
VTKIGISAFENCIKLNGVTIPVSVTSIADSAFKWCKRLTSIVIPNRITSLSDAVFSDCSALRSVTIPDSVTSIGNDAFWNCESLKSVKIPSCVNDIGEYAFGGCVNLTDITIPDGITNLSGGLFWCCKSLKNITIPSGVTSIGSYTFAGCTNITSITIPDGVTSINEGLFWCCESLNSITMPDCITSIGDGAFGYCGSLVSIAIPNSVTSIGNCTFQYCESLICITIPNCLTSIGDEAFEYCSVLSDVYYDGKIDEWNKIVVGELNEELTESIIHCTDGIVNCKHEFDDGVITKAATYTENGIKTYTCTICGATKTEMIPALKIIPPILKAVVNSNGSFTLSWNKVDGADKYDVYYDNGAGYKLLRTVTDTSITTSAAPYGKEYSYKVKAVNNSNATSDFSNIVTATNTTKLQTPTAKVTVNANGSFTISWNAVTGAEKYEVYIKNTDGSYRL